MILWGTSNLAGTWIIHIRSDKAGPTCMCHCFSWKKKNCSHCFLQEQQCAVGCNIAVDLYADDITRKCIQSPEKTRVRATPIQLLLTCCVDCSAIYTKGTAHYGEGGTLRKPVSYEISELGNIGIVLIIPREILEPFQFFPIKYRNNHEISELLVLLNK